MKIYIIIKNGYLKIVNHVDDDMIFQELDVPDNYDPVFVLERAEWLLEMFMHGQEHHLFMASIRRWVYWDESRVMNKIYAKLK